MLVIHETFLVDIYDKTGCLAQLVIWQESPKAQNDSIAQYLCANTQTKINEAQAGATYVAIIGGEAEDIQ